MARLLKLRFLDATDKEKPVFVTVFTEGKNKGLFKKDDKDYVTASAEGTTCRPQKGLTTEARVEGYGWKQVSENDFKRLLRDVNAMRLRNGWDTVELPDIKEDA